MPVALMAALLLQTATIDTVTLRGARSPAYATDGRLAISVDGDILVQLTSSAPLKRVTTGLPWDRDPAWTADGSAIVYASDPSGTGQYDLWRVSVAKDGTAGTPQRITTTPESETSPSVASDGSIAYLLGSGNGTRIWLRSPDGATKKLNTRDQTEISPRFSPDGSRIAYIVVTDAARKVMVRTVKTSAETTANSDKNAERIAWSPTGDRIALSSRTGIFVVPPDGRWTNFASTRRGDIAWSGTSNQLAVAEYTEVNVAYNGDPDRLGDRASAELFDVQDKMYFVNAPAAPDATGAEQSLKGAMDRAARNADAYDRAWERSTKLYFSQPDAAARRVLWEAAKTKHRAAAIAAKDDDELQRAIYAMLQDRPPLRNSASGRAAVSSAHPVSTEAGLEILRAGGNVVDAAVAVSFALGVVEPDASGVGGYGEMVIALSSLAKPTLIEFMTRVPEDAGLSNTSLLVNGRYPSDGPALTNVPGTTAGMYAAWTKYGSGKVPWKDLLAPAIRAARGGYVVSEGLATTLATEHDAFAKYESSRALFFRNGQPVVAGDTIKNLDLAYTLEQIAAKGADGFYKGDVAKKWIDDIHPKGNAMQLSDLARYYAPEREAVSGTYRGYTLWSSAPPVSGGAELVARMNLLEQFKKPLNYTTDVATLNAALTAWFLVPRGRVADPGLWPVDIKPMTNRDTARVRWGCFKADKALRPTDVRGDTLACLKALMTPAGSSSGARDLPQRETPDIAKRQDSLCGEDHALEVTRCRSTGTTAFTVADNEGNVVAVTQTLGTWGGNFYVAPGLGFLSNDKLTSYGTDPNSYGARLPFARNGSTLAPTIAFKGNKPVFAVGAAGNAWITSAVYQSLIGALDFGMNPQQALELPRFLPGGGGGPRGAAGGAAGYNIQMEDGFSPDVIKALRGMGYGVTFVSLPGELREGYGAAVSIDGKVVTAGADPRRSGAAGAVPNK